MQKLRLGGIFFFTSIVALGQHSSNKTHVLKQGSLAGRVFAITDSGDLKPARIADVKILYSSGVTREGKAVDDGDTAGLIYLEEDNKASDVYTNDLDREGLNWTDKMVCLKDLHMFYPVMVKTREWAETHKKINQIITTQTDENGYFSASLPAGQYIVLIRGRAGFNEALWIDDNVTIHSGMHTNVKFSSPKKSCLDMNN